MTRTLLRLLSIVVLAATGMTSAEMTEPVSADAATFGYFWEMHGYFDGDLNAELIIEAGYGGVGHVAKVLVTQTYPVACQANGNVSLTGAGAAEFNGGYLECEVDLLTALEETMERCGLVEPACALDIDDYEVYRRVRMDTQIKSPAWGIAPIFWHESAALSIDVGASQAAIQATMSPEGTFTTPFVPMAVLYVWQTYVAEYGCAPCDLHYALGGTNGTVNVGGAPVEFYTSETTFYVGYNEDTGETIPAGTLMEFWRIDPPNHGSDPS